MTRTCRGLVFLTAPAVTLAVVLGPGAIGQIVYPPALGSNSNDLPPATSAISAVVGANGGKIPATGEQLWTALGKLDRFSQLPVAFSAVRLNSGLANPRVVITPYVAGLGRADLTGPNLAGRLFLAANMEQIPIGADPRVTSVEFISWNTARRQFDFGVIENMGGDGTPELRIVDGGRCFACHKNRGPILGDRPWSNTTHLPLVRNLVATKLRIVEVVPPGMAGAGMRGRIDGMALVAPEAVTVDNAVRLGATLQLNREAFQLMNRSPGGRKAFVALLVAIAAPGPLDPNERHTKAIVDAWDDQSYIRFAADWVALAKATNSGILIDSGHFPKARAALWSTKLQPLPTPPASGFDSPAKAQAHERKVKMVTANNDAILKAIAAQAELISTYDMARAAGRHGLPSAAQPSNPKAFLPAPAKAAQKPSGIINPIMLAGVIGLTEGDRKFLTRSLADIVERLKKSNVTATKLARAVFEGPEFADVLSGGPLPDRDEFKDRFVAGLDGILKAKYPATNGFSVKRSDYASGPKYDPKAAEAKEIAVVPTTACLRCHDIRPSGKPRPFEPIPALAFDPFDKPGRQVWLRTADIQRREAVLIRLQQRLFGDSDMPPEDAPEYDRFRMKEEAAFNELKEFLHQELEKVKGN